MNKIKTEIPENLRIKCHKVIHTATTASAAAAIIPIPIADTVPISAAQVAMVVSLGKIFNMSLSESTAKSIAGIAVTRGAGRAVASNIIKCIPGVGTVVGGVINATTAVAFTEALGWVVADWFYQESIGAVNEENDIIKAVTDLKIGVFSDNSNV